MNFSLISALAIYAFVTSITPGPNNTMLLASGANYGLRATLPHMFGITFGFAFMLTAVGLGIGGLFTAFPSTYVVLRYVGAAYMIYLAWNIATSGSMKEAASGAGKPFSFTQAAAFQWINPKAWVLALGVATTYIPNNGYFLNLLLAAVVFSIVNFPTISVWAGAGQMLRTILQNERYLRIFNYAMAALLIASLYPMFAA